MRRPCHRFLLSPRLACGLLALAASSVVTGHAETVPAGTRAVLVVDGIKEVRNLPVLLAERLGFFKDEGLNVTLMEGRNDVPTDEMLMDARADGAVAFYHHTILSQAEGRFTEAVIVLGGSPGLKMLVADRLKGEIRTVADLKGRRIFTGGPNSGKTTAANWLFIKAGLTPADYVGLALRPREEMAEALRAGTAAAIVAHEPDATYYQTSGVASVLANLTSIEETRRNLGSEFPTTALYLSTAFVKGHPVLTQKLVNALYRSQRYINTHSATELLPLVPAEFVGKGPLAAVYANNLQEDMQMFATNGRLDPDAATAELKAMGNYAKKFTRVAIASTYTNDFVDQAARENKRP